MHFGGTGGGKPASSHIPETPTEDRNGASDDFFIEEVAPIKKSAAPEPNPKREKLAQVKTSQEVMEVRSN